MTILVSTIDSYLGYSKVPKSGLRERTNGMFMCRGSGKIEVCSDLTAVDLLIDDCSRIAERHFVEM